MTLSSSFLQLSDTPLYVCATSPLSFSPSVGIWLSPCLAVANGAAVNTGVRVSFQIMVLLFFVFFPGSLPRNGVAGSSGSTKALKLNLPQGEAHASRLPGN